MSSLTQSKPDEQQVEQQTSVTFIYWSGIAIICTMVLYWIYLLAHHTVIIRKAFSSTSNPKQKNFRSFAEEGNGWRSILMIAIYLSYGIFFSSVFAYSGPATLFAKI